MSDVGSQDKVRAEQVRKKAFLLSLIGAKRNTLVRNDDGIELFHVIDLDNDEWTTFADGYGSTSVVSILSDVFETEIAEGLDLLSIDISVPEYDLTLENVAVSFKSQTPSLRLQDLSLMTNMSIAFKKTKVPVMGGAQFVRMSPEDKEGAVRILQLIKKKKEEGLNANGVNIPYTNAPGADVVAADITDVTMTDSGAPADPGVEVGSIEKEASNSPPETRSENREVSPAYMALTGTAFAETNTSKQPSYKEFPLPRETTKEIIVSLPEKGSELAVVFNQDSKSNRINVVRSRSSRRILRVNVSPAPKEVTLEYGNRVSAASGNTAKPSFNTAFEEPLTPDVTDNTKRRSLETDSQSMDLSENQESLQKEDSKPESPERREIFDFDTTIQESSVVMDDDTMIDVDDINDEKLVDNEDGAVKKNSNPTYEVQIEMPSSGISLISSLREDENFRRIFRNFKKELLDSPMTPEGYSNRKLKIWAEIDGKIKVLDRHNSPRSLGLSDPNFEIKLTAEWRDERVEFQLMPLGDNPFTGRAYFRLGYAAKFKKAFSKYLHRTGYTLGDSKFYLKRDDFLMEISPEERPTDVNLEQNEKILVATTGKSITARE
jgi:hypothetical protein